MFSPSHQRVNVSSATPGATIKFEGDSIGVGHARVKLNKYRVYNTFTAEKEGYKSRSYCVTLKKFAPTVALAAIDALAFVVPTMVISRNIQRDGTVSLGNDLAIIPGFFLFGLLLTDLKHAKTHLYERDPVIPALKPYDTRNNTEKYMLVNNTKLDVPSSDMRFVNYKNLGKYYKSGNGRSTSSRSYTKDHLKIENTTFTGTLNYTLKKMKFIDTTNSVFPNINNCLYLDATIKKITFHEVESPYLNTAKYSGNLEKVMPNHLFSVELVIDWDVLDYYKEKKKTIRTVEKSDLVTLAYNPDEADLTNALFRALKDNMDFSIMSLRRQLTSQNMLKITNDQVKETVLELTRPQNVSTRKEDFSKYCVAVKVGDKLGSGTVVSEDGYIVTNYHYIAGKEKVEIVFADSSTSVAEVVRKNPVCDMALLKVQKNGLTPALLSDESDPEIGVDVWAAGVTHSSDRTVRLTRGIISGVRKYEGMTMLQTDASLNTANGGGPLVNEKGIVSGIVSFKVMGRGVEGIGFALSARDIMEKLSLMYK